MAILDEILAGLVAGLKPELDAAGLIRVRGGLARGIAWAEASGRGADGSWLELRLHHRPADRTLSAGLLVYEPLSRGGRTVPIGDRSMPYRVGPDEVALDLADDLTRWLELLGGRS